MLPIETFANQATPNRALNIDGPTQQIARITGATQPEETLPNPNQTHTRHNLTATDLGIMWDAGGGQIMMAFGDSYGVGWTGPGAGGPDWRSPVLAKSTDTELTRGLTFTTMIEDTPGHAKELLWSAHDTSSHGDWTNIPTAGITVGTRHYLHYMNIRAWGGGYGYTTNYSKIAFSDNDGQDWMVSDVQWGSNSNFGQAAFVRSGGYVYMFSTPPGRMGNCYLARVPEADMLKQNHYQYWDGSDWNTDQEIMATPIVVAPVGELSAQYNSYFGRWIMMYLNVEHLSIVIRDSATLTGPWTEEKVVARIQDYPQLYGGYIHPWTNNGTDLYYAMSMWGPYNVYLMRSTLVAKDQSQLSL